MSDEGEIDIESDDVAEISEVCMHINTVKVRHATSRVIFSKKY